jgi:homoserine O-succinyltransferase/O-acetyltransferase
MIDDEAIGLIGRRPHQREAPLPVFVDGYPGIATTFHRSTPDISLGCLHEDQSPDIEIGLVNNMPDPAMEDTARQFLTLLEAAAVHGVVIRLKLFSMPGVPSSDWRRRHLSTYYSDFSDLWDAPLDGLIVTGTEPRAADLCAEPYWTCLSKIVEWAEENTIATVWSCLAAHAAVLHLDGITRSPLNEKCFGVFEHIRASDHRLLRGLHSPILTPHSRWNEVREDALLGAGYHILSKSSAAGVDMFVKERKSLFLFFQGHPEYDADTLLREYRRDVGRFLRGERENYPEMPKQFFDSATTSTLNAFCARALVDRREELLFAFPIEYLSNNVSNTWRSQALCTYRNWLNYIVQRKASRCVSPAPLRRTGGA